VLGIFVVLISRRNDGLLSFLFGFASDGAHSRRPAGRSRCRD
jgi:hypothetical protein